MRRLMLALSSGITVIALVVPPAAQAATQTSTSQAVSQRITLPRSECAAVSGLLPSGCTIVETTHLTEVSVSGSTTYWQGYEQACAVVHSSGNCDPAKWWTKDYFNFTTSSSTGQAWNNGTPRCSSNHTAVTWCSYVDNGQTYLQEGYNWSNGGYIRMDVTGLLYNACNDIRGPGWANVSGWVSDGSTDYCPYSGA